ncbi:MAG TPA: hypothetical protein VG013_29450 [Gemmataceae bacterium]|nr:hypothetical protein [Gemmataceae bacterium]
MAELNQYAISQALASTMKPVKRGRFGGFGLLETLAEALRAREAISEACSAPGEKASFSYAEDAVVVRAFEHVRQGAAIDALLWNRELAKAFYQRCRELGLNAPDALLGRRLMTVRKNIRRYEKHGISISPTSKKEPHVSIVPQYAHVIEFVLMKLRYRYGASIDDILLERNLGEIFEAQAASLAAGVSSMDLRLGALYIRKTRNIKKKDRSIITSLDVGAIDRALTDPISLAKVKPEGIPEASGLLEVRENDRYLYIARNECLRPAVEQFRTGKAFDLVANGFWTPDLANITVQVLAGSKVDGVGIGLWERRLIHDLEPVFNWPIQGGEDEEDAA